jgi:PAS domain S-box-containing protein
VVNFDSKLDARTAQDYERTYAPNGERAYIAVPMMRENRWIATLWVSTDTPRIWSQEEVALLETVAERTWAAIERIRAEKALRQSEERFRQAADAASALIYEVDLSSGETAVVYGMERVVGYDPQTTDTTSGWWHSLIHPEDLPAHLAQLEENLKRGGTFLTEYRVQHKSGTWLIVQDNGLVITENGTAIRIVGAITDITARKQMEENLSIELADTKQLQVISSQLIQEDNINLLYEQIIDAAIALMRSDMGSLQMFYPEKNAFLLLAWRGFDQASAAFWEWVGVDSTTTCGEALRTGGRVIVPDIETSNFIAGTKDLDFYRLFGIKTIQSTPLVSRNGHIVGMISTHWCQLHQVSERNLNLLDVLARQAADLIERKRAEEAILRLNEVLEMRVIERTAALAESEREVRRMASMLTMAEQEERRRISRLLHDELQQQLYAIQINLTFAQSDVESGNTLMAIERLAEADQWLSQGIEITRQLTVDLSPPILKSEGLADALKWLISQMKQIYGLEVSLTAEHAFRMPTEDMRVLLFQVIRELLFNVVKHAGTSKAAIELRSQHGQLVITVMDKGRGFNAAEAGILAEQEGRFGLYSVRERVGLFGGRIEINSTPGSGTRILIHIPTDLEGNS